MREAKYVQVVAECSCATSLRAQHSARRFGFRVSEKSLSTMAGYWLRINSLDVYTWSLTEARHAELLEFRAAHSMLENSSVPSPVQPFVPLNPLLLCTHATKDHRNPVITLDSGHKALVAKGLLVCSSGSLE